jgi:hypothetical protein
VEWKQEKGSVPGTISQMPKEEFVYTYCNSYTATICTRINKTYWPTLAHGIATGYGLDDRGVGVRVPVGSRIVSSPNRPDRL